MGTEGDDLVFGSAFSDTFSALGGNDTVFGQEESDSLLGQDGNDQINGNRGNDTISGGAGDDSLRGGRDADSVLGDAGNDTVFGDRDSDTVRGGEGRDIIYGGKENDDVAGGEDNDFVSGDIGDDTVVGDAGNDTLLGQAGNDIMSGGLGLDLISGGEDADSISGDEDNDSLAGNQGNDTLDGGTGDDSLSGGKDDDLLLGGEGSDTLNGERENDTLDGGEGNDFLSGGRGNDSLDGGQGDDLLIGGRGDDTLTGGEGEDSFVVVDFEESDNLYTITDFNTAEDLISLEGGLTFEDLEISDEGSDTIIRNANGETLAILIGVDSTTLNPNNFFPEPVNTEPPVTDPPVTDPPVTDPPVTDPPVTEPPVTDPPVTDPPVTDPPVTDPPVTDPPVTDPPVTDPPVTDPPVTDPPVTDPPATTAPPITPDPDEVTPPSLNEPPTDILLDNDSVEENSEAGTVVGTFTTEDPDVDDFHEYRLIDNADGRFALDEDRLVVGEGADLDFEEQETYDIQVRSFDNAGENITRSFTINLINVNDPPEITVPDDQQLVNEGEQLDIVGIQVTDPDAGDGDLEVSLETTNSQTIDSNLTLNSTSGLTFTTGDGQADAEIVFTGNLDNINQAISTLTYTGNNSGSDSISISVNDQGNTGEGDAQTDTALIDISINDLPLVATNNELVVNTEETGIIDNTLLETTDDSNTTLIYTVTELPTRGNLLIDGGSFTSFTQEDIEQGLLTYEHDTNDTENDSFSFSVSDQVGGETTDTFEIRVNVPPTVTSNNLSVDEQVQGEITNENLLAEDPDTDAGAETLIYELTELPTSGEIQLDNATLELTDTFTQKDINQGSLTYQGEEVGTDTFSYVVTDQDGGTTSGLLNIDIEPGNTAPEANDDEFETNEDTAITIDRSELLANDTDPDGDEITITEFADNIQNGTLEETEDSFIYTPDENFSGSESFTYTVADSKGLSNTANVTINVTPVADTPNLAVSTSSVSGNQDEEISLDITASLFDTSGSETLSITISGVPDGATLSAGTDQGNGTWVLTLEELENLTLTPSQAEQTEVLNFELTVTATATETANSDTTSDSGVIAVEVSPLNNSPIAEDDEFETNEDTAITIDKSELLANDTEPDGEEITITEFAADNIQNGTLEETADSFIYTPNDNFSGSESFTYTVADSEGLTDTANVTINVTPVADTPNLAVSTPTVSGTDQDDLPLGITASLVDSSGSETLSIAISGVPDGATLSAGTDQGNGSWVLTPEELANLTLSPPGDRDTGTIFSFDLTVTATATETANNDTATQTGTISVAVEALNDAPVLTDPGDIALTTINENEINNAGTPVADIIAAAVTDADGGASSGVAITQIDNSNGLWQYSVDSGVNWVDVNNSNTTLLTATTNERLRFVPNTDFFGNATIQFRAWDTTDGSSNTTQLTDISTIGGTNAFSEGVGTANILVNDIPEVINNNELVINLGETGTINQNFLQTTDADNGTNTFTYTVTTELISGILQQSDNPTNTFTQEDINSGLVIYQHTANNTNDDSFSFQVIDVNGGQVTDTFNIRVNDPPVGTTTDLNVTLGEAKVIATENLQFIDPDVETATSASLQYTLTELPTSGELQQGGETLAVGSTFTQENLDNGEISYATTTGSLGTDSFNFLVTDQDGGTTSELLNINIIEANRPPQVEADKTVTLEEDTTTTAILNIPAPTDPDGDTFTITVDSIPDAEIGQVVLDNTTNTALTIGQQLTTEQLTSLTFLPVENANGNAGTFSYIVDDGNDENNSATQVISIDVTPVNDPPIAVDDGPVFTNLGNELIIDIFANDSDVDGPNSLSIDVLRDNDGIILGLLDDQGTQVAFNSIGSLGIGTDTFEYTVTDGADTLNLGTATVTVNVLDVTDAADSLVGGESNDNFDGELGDDTLEGLGGNDTLAGNDDNDSLVGGEGNDSIDGGDGNDTFVGGLGADTLSENNGDNTFVYTSANDGGGANFNAVDATSIGTAISAGVFDRITGFDDLGVVGGDTLAFSSTVLPNLDNIATNVQTTDIPGNVLTSGTPGLFAYEVEGKTYLIYDANGDNTVGDDSQIIAELDVSGVVALDVNDDFTII
ncbi:tandem-95 repeat protein [Dapis sp. BLCC M229]|uniref:tandem-95 repeat protein n=1 Tax=Dapis sp. BLCC M229 TaxID=3400188 RepID=UPI003CF57565